MSGPLDREVGGVSPDLDNFPGDRFDDLAREEEHEAALEHDRALEEDEWPYDDDPPDPL